MQAQALEQLMANEIFHAPISNPKRILDVGCGTGRSTVQLAERFLDTAVIGVDLSPVPTIHSKPDNVSYVQGNVLELIKAGAEPFTPNSFDYVFSRLLVFGMTDWQGYIDQITSILAPGGWFEIQEMEVAHRDVSGAFVSDESPVTSTFVDLLRRKGMEPMIGVEASKLMRNAGLVDVGETPYRVPYIEEPDNPRTAMISRLASNYGISLRSLWYKVGEGVYSKEDLDNLSQEFIDIYANFLPGAHTRFDVVIGRKEV